MMTASACVALNPTDLEDAENITPPNSRTALGDCQDSSLNACDDTDTCSGEPEVSISFRSGGRTMPRMGGEIPYIITFTNVDFNDFFKEYSTWSTITLPNGKHYRLSRRRKVFLRAGEKMLNPIPRLSIPSWFPEGEYSLTLYIEDRDGSKPVTRSSSFSFKKLGVCD